MKKQFEELRNAVVVHPCDELDQYAAAELKSKIDIEMENSLKKNLIIDLSEVVLMDSSGIGLILGRYKNLKAIGGSVAVCSAEGSVRRVLMLSGIEKIIPYYENKEEADRSFKKDKR